MAEFALEDLLTLVVSLAISTVLFHFAAKIVLDRSEWTLAFAAALAGSLVAGLIEALLPGTTGRLVALVAWSLILAVMFRTGPLKGAVVGLVAWGLWFLLGVAFEQLARVL